MMLFMDLMLQVMVLPAVVSLAATTMSSTSTTTSTTTVTGDFAIFEGTASSSTTTSTTTELVQFDGTESSSTSTTTVTAEFVIDIEETASSSTTTSTTTELVQFDGTESSSTSTTTVTAEFVIDIEETASSSTTTSTTTELVQFDGTASSSTSTTTVTADFVREILPIDGTASSSTSTSTTTVTAEELVWMGFTVKLTVDSATIDVGNFSTDPAVLDGLRDAFANTSGIPKEDITVIIVASGRRLLEEAEGRRLQEATTVAFDAIYNVTIREDNPLGVPPEEAAEAIVEGFSELSEAEVVSLYTDALANSNAPVSVANAGLDQSSVRTPGSCLVGCERFAPAEFQPLRIVNKTVFASDGCAGCRLYSCCCLKQGRTYVWEKDACACAPDPDVPLDV